MKKLFFIITLFSIALANAASKPHIQMEEEREEMNAQKKAAATEQEKPSEKPIHQLITLVPWFPRTTLNIELLEEKK